MSDILAYVAGAIALAWGVAHLMPTPRVVAGDEPLTADNRQILTMEWVAEGLTLVFLGVLIVVVTTSGSPSDAVRTAVTGLTAGMLLVMAGLTAATGARTRVVFFRICPIVKTAAAVLLVSSVVLA
jgi:hypothetical protein